MRKAADIGFQALDPQEAWEIDFTEAAGGVFFRSRRPGHPYAPRGVEEIPAGALHALGEACDVSTLGQVFVIPWAVRSTGCSGQKVITPNSVLGLGDRAVGLWTEKPLPGVKIAIALGKVGRCPPRKAARPSCPSNGTAGCAGPWPGSRRRRRWHGPLQA